MTTLVTLGEVQGMAGCDRTAPQCTTAADRILAELGSHIPHRQWWRVHLTRIPRTPPVIWDPAPDNGTIRNHAGGSD
jgi:hypothetical protein